MTSPSVWDYPSPQSSSAVSAVRNPRLIVERHLDEENKRSAISDGVASLPGPGLLYPASRKDAESYAESLRDKGIAVALHLALLFYRPEDLGRAHFFTATRPDEQVLRAVSGVVDPAQPRRNLFAPKGFDALLLRRAPGRPVCSLRPMSGGRQPQDLR